MRSPRLSFALPLLLSILPFPAHSETDIPLDCLRNEADAQCQKPLKAVTAVTPGRFYIATVPCVDCPVRVSDGPGKYHVAHMDTNLFYNISLSHDNRTLLLNDKPIFPSIATTPPPTIHVPQVRPNFSRTSLDQAIECSRTECESSTGQCPCMRDAVSTAANIDFDYSSKWLESHPDTHTERWEMTFDAIGGQDGAEGHAHRVFNDTEQLMLRIIVEGEEMESEGRAGAGSSQAGGGLFGQPEADEAETRYDLRIASVELMERSFTFPPAVTPTVWGRTRHFFGWEPTWVHGHLVYVADEWDAYGKKGTLRNVLGEIIHDWPWDLVGSVVGGVLGGVVVVYGFYKLVLLVMRQRELARWDGMDTVWERLRRERPEEEEDGLLRETYRDEPEGGRPSVGNYRDDVDTMKPLPSKPLPDKPLPAVPLIDA